MKPVILFLRSVWLNLRLKSHGLDGLRILQYFGSNNNFIWTCVKAIRILRIGLSYRYFPIFGISSKESRNNCLFSRVITHLSVLTGSCPFYPQLSLSSSKWWKQREIAYKTYPTVLHAPKVHGLGCEGFRSSDFGINARM